MALATLGRGTVPALPEDVRRLIRSHTFPRAMVWCSACAIEVVVELESGERVPVNTHPIMWLDTPRCRGCALYVV